MSKCPNVSSTEWKLLVKQVGEDNAWRQWVGFDGNVPVIPSADIKKAIGWGHDMDIMAFNRLVGRTIKYNNDNNTNHKVARQPHPNNPGRWNPELTVIDYLPNSNEKLQKHLDKIYPGQNIRVNNLGQMITDMKQEQIPIAPIAPSLFDFKKGSNQKIQPVINLFKNLESKMPGINQVIITPEKAIELTKGHKTPWNGDAGFYHNGIVYLVDGFFDADTQMHEFIHPLIDAIFAHNPELAKNLINQFTEHEEGLKIWADVERDYKEDFDADGMPEPKAMKEMLVRAVTHEAMNIANKHTTPFQKVVRAIMDAIRQVFQSVFGKDVIDIKELKTSTTIGELAKLMTDDSTIELHMDLFAQADDPSGTPAFKKASQLTNSEALFTAKELNDAVIAKAAALQDIFIPTNAATGKRTQGFSQLTLKNHIDAIRKTVSEKIEKEYFGTGQQEPQTAHLNFWQYQYFKKGLTVSDVRAAEDFMSRADFDTYITKAYNYSGKNDLGDKLRENPNNLIILRDRYENYKKASDLMNAVMLRYPSEDKLWAASQIDLLRDIEKLLKFRKQEVAFVLEKLMNVYVSKWLANRMVNEMGSAFFEKITPQMPDAQKEYMREQAAKMRTNGIVATDFLYNIFFNEKGKDAMEYISLFESPLLMKSVGIQLASQLVDEARVLSANNYRRVEPIIQQQQKNIKRTGADIENIIVEIKEINGDINEYFVHENLPQDQFNLLSLQTELRLLEQQYQQQGLLPEEYEAIERDIARVNDLIEKREFFDRMNAYAAKVPTVTGTVNGKAKTYKLFDHVPSGTTKSEKEQYKKIKKEIEAKIKEIEKDKASIDHYQLEMLSLKTFLDTHQWIMQNPVYGGFKVNNKKAFAVPQNKADKIELIRSFGWDAQYLQELDPEHYLDDIFVRINLSTDFEPVLSDDETYYIYKDGSHTNIRYGTYKASVLRDVNNKKITPREGANKIKSARHQAQLIFEKAQESESGYTFDKAGNIVISPKQTPTSRTKFTRSKYRSKEIGGMLVNYYQGLFFKNSIEAYFPIINYVAETYHSEDENYQKITKGIIDYNIIGKSPKFKLKVAEGWLDFATQATLWSRLGFNIGGAWLNLIAGQAMLFKDYNIKYLYDVGKYIAKAGLVDKELSWMENTKKMYRILNNMDIINLKEQTAVSIENKWHDKASQAVFFLTRAVEMANQLPWIMMNVDLEYFKDYDENGVLLPGKKGIPQGIRNKIKRDVTVNAGPYVPGSEPYLSHSKLGKAALALRRWQIGMIYEMFGNMVWPTVRSAGRTVYNVAKRKDLSSFKELTAKEKSAFVKVGNMIALYTLISLMLNDDDDEKKAKETIMQWANIDEEHGWFMNMSNVSAVLNWIQEVAEFLFSIKKGDRYERNSVYDPGRWELSPKEFQQYKMNNGEEDYIEVISNQNGADSLFLMDKGDLKMWKQLLDVAPASGLLKNQLLKNPSEAEKEERAKAKIKTQKEIPEEEQEETEVE